MTSGPGSDDLAESTLEAEDRDDDSLIRAIAAAPAMPIATLTPGTLVAGKYRLVSMLGRGGMGVVWRASDDRLDRAVAVKFQLGTGRESGVANEVERLRREARALASLSHPHVVTVLEVGVHEGATYVAMELVDGGNARQWLEARPRSWREIVALYRQAGEGLVAAHRVGIVHRDFKPDNVLVGADGRARVADFGLARPQAFVDGKSVLRELDRTLPIGVDPHGVTAAPELATRTGALVGTPAYMAPEQLSTSRVDARADQFSFCVALFEALYGDRPFKSMASLADPRVVPIPRGRGTVARAPGWLLRVVQRGLARDPDARWPSMTELLEKLDRRRTRRAWLVPAVLVGGVAAFALARDEAQPRRCVDADDVTTLWNRERAAEVERALVAAGMPGDLEWRRLSPRLDEFAASWSDAWRTACAAADDRALDGRLACLRAHRAELVAIVDLLASADTATASNLGTIEEHLDDPAACLGDEASAVAAPSAGLAGDVEALRRPLASAKAHSAAGHYRYAAALLDPIVARAHEIGYLPLMADALYERGVARGRDGRPEEALADLTDAYSIALGEHQDERALSAAVIVPITLQALGRDAEALAWCERTRALAERWREHETLHAQLLVIEGKLLMNANRNELGATRIAEAAELAEHAGDAYVVALVGEAQADVQAHGGRFDRAVDLQRRAHAGLVALLGAEHPRAAKAERMLGYFLVRADRRAEGRKALQHSNAAIAAVFGPDHGELVQSLLLLAEIEAVEGDSADAYAILEKARALELRQHPPNAEHLGRIDDSMAIALAALGRYDDAVEVHRRALAAFEERDGQDDPGLRYPLSNLGLASWDAGHLEDAVASFRRAIAIDDAQAAPDALSATLHYNSGFLQIRLGDLDGAEAEFERARALVLEALPPGDSEIAWPLMGLGRIALKRGRSAEAVELFDAALARWDVGTDQSAYRELQRDLVLALWSAGDRARARMVAREALAADPEHEEIAAFLRARAR